MKQKLLFLFSFLLTAVCSHAATTVTVDGMVYSLSDTTATVASQSKNKALTDVIIPEHIEYEGKSYNVTSITTSAFSGCTALTSISIPGSVTSIGASAFSGCTALNNVIFEDGEDTLSLGYENASCGLFYYCPLETLHIGRPISYKTSSATPTYGYSPFYNKTTIKNITFGKYFKDIPNYAFSGCSNIESLILPDSLASLGSRAFYGCSSLQSITIPISATFTSIGASAFSGCAALTSILIPGSVTSIGESAFSGCTALTSILIPDSVTSIGNYTFSGCTALNNIIFEDGETKLSLGYTSSGQGLFYDCPIESLYLGRTISYSYSPFKGKSKLSSLTIGNNVSSIGKEAFSGCSALISVSIPNSVTSISLYAFDNCSSLRTLIIEDSETTLNMYATTTTGSADVTYFDKCPIEDLYIGRNINYFWRSSAAGGEYYLGSIPFGRLESLKSVIIGDFVTELDNGFFQSCSAIQNVYLSRSLATIGNSVFHDSKVIREIRCAAEIPPAIGSHVFPTEIYSFTTLSVPSSSQSDYSAAAVWKEFMHVDNFNPGSREINGIYYILNNSTETAMVTYQKQNDMSNYQGLTNVVIPETIEYNDVTYTIVGVGPEAFNYCWGLKSISLPETIESIDTLAFGYCTSLRSIEIPNSVKTIGNEAFTGCSALSSATIGEAVESIGDYGFFGCTGLSEITVPQSVTHIGEYAFMGVHWLNEVHAESIIPSDAHATAFSTTAYKNATLYVPAGTLATYQAHPTWSKFLNMEVDNGTMSIDEPRQRN